MQYPNVGGFFFSCVQIGLYCWYRKPSNAVLPTTTADAGNGNGGSADQPQVQVIELPVHSVAILSVGPVPILGVHKIEVIAAEQQTVIDVKDAARAAEVDQPPEPPVLPEAEVSSALAPRASPPLPSVWPSHGAPATSGALEEARAALDLLQGELQGPDHRSAQGRLGLISGWLKADASVRAAWGSVEEAQKVLGVAAMARASRT